ncbi:Pre-mRNA-splicing factor Syf2, partial [Pseudolycoriella hygida]
MEGEKTAAEKMKDRMERLKKLHLARNEARQHNHQEAVEEDARNKLPTNWATRKRQADWLAADEKARKDATDKGLDYDRKKKKNADVGFSDYEAQTARQYNRLVKQMPARDMVKYEEQKAALGDAFYGDAHTIQQGLHKDDPKAINNMVKDLENQISKRKSFSRRRTHNDDASIDFINEKNARFNKKLERFYGEHTAEIKQHLERASEKKRKRSESAHTSDHHRGRSESIQSVFSSPERSRPKNTSNKTKVAAIPSTKCTSRSKFSSLGRSRSRTTSDKEKSSNSAKASDKKRKRSESAHPSDHYLSRSRSSKYSSKHGYVRHDCRSGSSNDLASPMCLNETGRYAGARAGQFHERDKYLA